MYFDEHCALHSAAEKQKSISLFIQMHETE
jgi:hypothetical protein